MTKAMVIAETEGAARELCAGARTLADEVVLVTFGNSVVGVADACINIDVPANRVVDDAYVTLNKIADTEAPVIVVAESTPHVLSLVGRLANHFDTAAITGVFDLADGAASSMYFGGQGIRVAKPAGDVKIYAMNSGVYNQETATGTDMVKEAQFEEPARVVTKIGSEALPASDVNLDGADIVIACGRGFQSQDDLGLARELGNKIGAELGCSRPLAEGVNWFPRETYIGVSGKVISPRVYFIVGISGQMQHMVGCNGSGKVIAINKDKSAPVFAQCDLGFVGDLKTVLPALTANL